mmetsp:Transcript_20405/g.31211  ORF Transcript_20405/g.31211 Transcript_20405/m.31211 type:complete len:150 (+) Transcript_20405:233-682(+)
MTYRSRGRSAVELVLAVSLVAFLVGFISVLCIGNYLRARRAMELQRQRRLAKHAKAMKGNDCASSVAGNPPQSDVGSSWERQKQYETTNTYASEQDMLLPGGRHPYQRRPHRNDASEINSNNIRHSNSRHATAHDHDERSPDYNDTMSV